MVHDEPDLREYVLLGMVLFHLGVDARAVRDHDDPVPLVVRGPGSGLHTWYEIPL